MANAKGEILFKLPEGRNIEGEFIDGYALISNGGIIDTKGNIVFELSETDFDKIYFSGCMDIGYILCSKEVNTFEETGTQYYAVNFKEGTSRRIQGDLIPTKVRDYRDSKTGKEWVYFSGGYFVYSPAASWETPNHVTYNILTDTYSEEQYIFDRFWSRQEFALDNNIVYWVNFDGKYYSYDLTTGKVNEESLNNDDVDMSGYFVYRDGKIYGSRETIINVLTGDATSMTDYADYEYFLTLEDGSYFVMVKNDGGGLFVTVVNVDGSRKFEPIVCKKVSDSCENYFVMEESGGGKSVYTYDGKRVGGWSDSASSSYYLGNETVLYYENDDIVMLNVKTGESIKLDKELIHSLHDCTGNSANGYVVNYNNKCFLLHEDGTVTYFVAK